MPAEPDSAGSLELRAAIDQKAQRSTPRRAGRTVTKRRKRWAAQIKVGIAPGHGIFIGPIDGVTASALSACAKCACGMQSISGEEDKRARNS
jgi:hypothetical protein